MGKNKTPVPLSESQFTLFDAPAAGQLERQSTPIACPTGRRFLRGDPEALYIGNRSVKAHLEQLGIQMPFVVADILDTQDWQPFEAQYALTGRAPYAPRAMMGLILYGVMQGIYSLRGIEHLARVDVTCMWVTGGITPDHANIGRFIARHEHQLTHDFFEAVTRTVLHRMGSKSDRLAGDGTVIEAACSHYRHLKAEAVNAWVQQAEQDIENAIHHNEPTEQAAHTLERAHDCQKVLHERQQARRKQGKSEESLKVSSTEPDAAIQKQKRGRGFAAVYTPSVLANEHRVIVAYAVDVTSETRVIPTLLDQSDRVAPSQQRQLLLDTGYFTDSVIQQAFARDIDVLCPPKKSTANAACTPYHKNPFHYDEYADVYHCPAGERLHRISHTQKTERSRESSLYCGAPCHACSHRQACTKAAYGRRIKHYPEDEARVALQHVMDHPKANEAFRGRKAMVEPVFASLREQQGLRRFRRRGLTGVIHEFALHAMAYNLARAVVFYRLLQEFCVLFWCGILALLNPIVRRRKYTEFCAEMKGP